MRQLDLSSTYKSYLSQVSVTETCHPTFGNRNIALLIGIRSQHIDIFRSEVDDVNLGLEHFYGDFNVVHVRLISSGVRIFTLGTGINLTDCQTPDSGLLPHVATDNPCRTTWRAHRHIRI